MKQQFLDILDKLKENKIPISKVEKELEFANGYLGKIRDDENRSITQENLDKLIAYATCNTSFNSGKIEVTPKTKLVVSETGLQEKPSDETLKETRALMDKINKQFGAGTIMLLGDTPLKGLDVISTGSIGLDIALGIGGLPRGRIVEIYGPESSGKTTIALQVIANAQKKGLKCVLIDAENSFDPEYASNLGVKTNELLYCQPDCGEQALEIADQQILSNKIGVCVIDSVAALVPKSELEGEIGESKIGAMARLMSQACRKLVGSAAKTNTLLIFINQIRNKIGVIYGSPEVTTGGMALQFYSSIRIDIRRQAQIKDGEVVLGNRTKAKVVKNKCCPPFRTAEFDIIYGQGVGKTGEIVDIGVEKGIIQKSGSWFSYGTDKLGQGRQQAIEILDSNPELFEIIEKQIMASK